MEECSDDTIPKRQDEQYPPEEAVTDQLSLCGLAPATQGRRSPPAAEGIRIFTKFILKKPGINFYGMKRGLDNPWPIDFL
jgi:hypothetical protein